MFNNPSESGFFVHKFGSFGLQNSESTFYWQNLLKEAWLLNRSIDNNGYRRFRDSNKLVHRWVMEKTLGRKLKPGEIVHHIDRNKLNNSPENLEVFANQDEHQKHHDQTDWLYTLSRKLSRRFRFKL